MQPLLQNLKKAELRRIGWFRNLLWSCLAAVLMTVFMNPSVSYANYGYGEFPVIIYDEANFGGNQMGLSRGAIYSWDWGPLQHGKISSVQVLHGYQVTLYGQGRALVLTEDTPWVDNDFNLPFLWASVERIYPQVFPVTLYQEANLGGDKIDLREGTSYCSLWGSLQYAGVSSGKVSPGYKVTFGGDGDTLVLTADTPQVDDDFNSRFYWAAVEKIE